MAGADDLAPAGDGSAVRHAVDVEGIPMSALLAEAPQPRAVILALHGGAATSGYFDAPNQPRLSLLRTGAALGFTVLALDRPGYGSSAPRGDAMASAQRRVDLAYAAVSLLLGARPQGAGVFVVGHSLGCALAIQMAGDERGAGLLGLEIAGIGRHHHPRAAAVLETRMLDRAERDGTGSAMRDMIWGPDHLYPAGAAAGVYSPVPGYEGDEVRRWPRDFPALAARVRIPVHYSLGDHERVWRSGHAALADVAGLFTASPRVVAEEQAGGGHNLSLGLSALAYHLKVLSFAEECALALQDADARSGDARAGAAAPIELAGG
jgi:pimeloyl-ACP methyl ester carboxylesterase